LPNKKSPGNQSCFWTLVVVTFGIFAFVTITKGRAFCETMNIHKFGLITIEKGTGEISYLVVVM
jgi:hypothetical protein